MTRERIIMTKCARDNLVRYLIFDGVGKDSAYELASAMMHLLNRNGIRATKKFLEDACQAKSLQPYERIDKLMLWAKDQDNRPEDELEDIDWGRKDAKKQALRILNGEDE
jgi:hypothetical protein